MNDIRTCPRCGRSLITPGKAAEKLREILSEGFRPIFPGSYERAINSPIAVRDSLRKLASELDCPTCPESTLFLTGGAA